MKMVKVKLKEGLGRVGNAHFDLVEGVPADIPDHYFNPETMEKLEEKAAPKPAEPINEDGQTVHEYLAGEKSFKQELIDLPGIGPKIADKILSLAQTKEGLGKIPRQTLIDELRDDVVVVLDNYLGRGGNDGSQ